MSPEDLLKQARAEAPKGALTPKGMFTRHVRAIEVLRRKGFTFAQIAEWLIAHGIPVKYPSSLNGTLKKWGQTQDYIDFCAEEDKEKALDEV